MEKITLLDTAVGSTNRGDEIIMQCVEEELAYLLDKYFVLRTPTHLRGFGVSENLGRLPDSANEIYNSKYKFVCGTNLLINNMKNRTNQWNINLWNSKPIENSILVGVGGGGTIKNIYTKKLYKKVLSDEYIHSVRTQAAYDMVTSLGLKCLNTGCVTLWKLTPEFCASIPKKKSNKVIFTLTDYNQDIERDKKMIEIIKRNYEEVLFWIQGAHDLEYLKTLTNDKSITIIPSSVKAYEKVLCEPIDYIGTRLHAGIFAMRHAIRSIIITIDERMSAMEGCIPNNCISRKDIDKLEDKINCDLSSSVSLDWNAIKQWKGQFK